MQHSEFSAFVRQLGSLAISVLALYLIAVFASLLIHPPRYPANIDTNLAAQTMFLTAPKLILLGRKGLESPGPKAIMLGMSNTQVAFPVDELAAALPDYSVHNLAKGASNVTETVQIAELAQKRMPDAEDERSVFVIGVWYGMMIDNHARWGSAAETDLDREKRRYGFSRRTPRGEIEIVPDAMIEWATIAMYPTFSFEWAIRSSTDALRHRYLIGKPIRSDDELNTDIMPGPAREAQLEYWRGLLAQSEGFDQQIAELERLVERLLDDGHAVVIANLPLPKWHKESIPEHGEFTRRIREFCGREFAALRFRCADLTYLDDEDFFYDEAHVRPRSRSAWISALRDAIHSLDTADAAGIPERNQPKDSSKHDQ